MLSDIAGLREQIKDNAETRYAIYKSCALPDLDLRVAVYQDASHNFVAAAVRNTLGENQKAEPLHIGGQRPSMAEALNSLADVTASSLNAAISDKGLEMKFQAPSSGKTSVTGDSSGALDKKSDLPGKEHAAMTQSKGQKAVQENTPVRREVGSIAEGSAPKAGRDQYHGTLSQPPRDYAGSKSSRDKSSTPSGSTVSLNSSTSSRNCRD